MDGQKVWSWDEMWVVLMVVWWAARMAGEMAIACGVVRMVGMMADPLAVERDVSMGAKLAALQVGVRAGKTAWRQASSRDGRRDL